MFRIFVNNEENRILQEDIFAKYNNADYSININLKLEAKEKICQT